jgi:hypothetical protein
VWQHQSHFSFFSVSRVDGGQLKILLDDLWMWRQQSVWLLWYPAFVLLVQRNSNATINQ